MTRPTPRPSDPGSTRREFLKKTSLAASAVAVTGAAPAAFSRTRAFNEPIQIAVLGTGGMGTGHLRALLDHSKEGRESLKIVACADVCKPHLDRALEHAREKQGIEVRGYRNYRELLDAETDVQAVWIASPEHWHAQMAIDSIRAGKDVYVEKPMTLQLDAAMELWREEQSHDRIVQVGTQYTTQPKYHHAQELIRTGAIGHPIASQTSYCRNTPAGEWNYYEVNPDVKPGEMLDWEAWCGELGPRPFDTLIFHRWRRYRDFSTGIIGDLLVHKMTPMIMALDVGWPARVTATGGHYIDKAMENHDTVNVTIQFEREHTMIVNGATCNERGLDDLIRGQMGNLELGGNKCVLRPERAFADEVDPETFQYEYEEPQHRHQLDFLRSVRTREAPRSNVELGLKIMVIVDLASRSLWEGSAFGYSPASMTSYRV